MAVRDVASGPLGASAIRRDSDVELLEVDVDSSEKVEGQHHSECSGWCPD